MATADKMTSHDHLHIAEEHMHSIAFVRPTGAAPITLTSGAGAWNLGAFSNDIIAANDITEEFDLHWGDISAPSANDDYEIVLYYGAGDTECARISFSRSGVFVGSIQVGTMTPRIPANSRVRAKMMDGTGSRTANIKLAGHEY